MANLILPFDARFDQARRERIWNQRLALERCPAAIATIATSDQARAAILFARRHGLGIAVRGHGHNYEAAALRDGTLMLDLAPLNAVRLDAEGRTAWAGAAVSGGDLLEYLMPHGLAFPIGHCAHVPLSGYVLAGGFGWNAGEWGAAAANVTAIELVTAAGELLTVHPAQHEDLFWAALGSGTGFFAGVLRYRLRLHPLPAASYSWSATFPIESAPEIAGWLSEAVARCDPTAEIICLVGPDHESGAPAVIVRASASADTKDRARDKIAAFHCVPNARLLSAPEGEFLPFDRLTKLSAMPDGRRVACDHLWSNGPLGDMLLAVRHLAGVPAKSSSINLFSPGGGRPVPGCDGVSGALSIGGGAGAGIYAMWDDQTDDARHLQWVRDADAALSRFRCGRYVGETSLKAGPARVSECFTPDALSRIEDLRKAWDPDDLFGGFPV